MNTDFNGKKIKEYVKKIKYDDSEYCKTTYLSKNKLILEDSLKEFIEHISKHISVFVTQIQNKTNFYLGDYWFQTYGYEGSHEIHIHNPVKLNFSLIYYVKSSVNSGATRFYNPGYPYVNQGQIDIKPEDNKLVIFPGHLAHQALPNKDKERIIFSANFTIE